MASAAVAAVARGGRVVTSRISQLTAASGSRSVHSSGAKQMGSKGESSYNDYIHAEHMYNIPGMKHRKLKIGLGVFGSLAIGTAVPIIAVLFQQKKIGGG